MTKAEIREQSLLRRNAEPDREAKSEIICSRVLELPEYKSAKTVLLYFGVRSEVQTRSLISESLKLGKTIVLPASESEGLSLYRITAIAELLPGAFGIMELSLELRKDPARRCPLEEIDLAVLPGVAFDKSGGRIGYGKGHYDKLFAAEVRHPIPLFGLSFECQLFPSLPLEAHDERVNGVITEAGIYK